MQEQQGNVRLIGAAANVFFTLARFLSVHPIRCAEWFGQEKRFLLALQNCKKEICKETLREAVQHSSGPWHRSSVHAIYGLSNRENTAIPLIVPGFGTRAPLKDPPAWPLPVVVYVLPEQLWGKPIASQSWGEAFSDEQKKLDGQYMLACCNAFLTAAKALCVNPVLLAESLSLNEHALAILAAHTRACIS